MKSGFLINENLPKSLASVLAETNLSVEHVNQLGLAGKEDSLVWKHAIDSNLVVVTKDSDYLDLSFGTNTGAVIHVAVGNLRVSAVKEVIRKRMIEITAFMNSDDRILVVRS